jgi:CelD/BcsL family acetyltransferase involved in cellulose biosynthesis
MSTTSAALPDVEEGVRFALLDPLADRAWEAFVGGQPAALVFHRTAWLQLLHEQYGFRPLAACAMRDGAIVAGLPICELRPPLRAKRWISLPFSDRCGPIGADPATVDRLMAWTVREAATSGASLEVRDRISPSAGMAESVGRWQHITRLEGTPAQVLERLHPDVRRRIRKSLTSGLKSEVRSDARALDEFYRLHLLTRRRHGVPIQPRRYFERFQRLIIDQGLGHVVLTRDGDRTLSAGVFCRDQRCTLYKYGASDPAASDVPANYLMFWTSMTHALDSGCRTYDFGKTAASHESLRFFKKKWATEESPLPYHYSPRAPASTEPGFLLTHVVRPIIRNSPVTVCRVAGEALYKHFAP